MALQVLRAPVAQQTLRAPQASQCHRHPGHTGTTNRYRYLVSITLAMHTKPIDKAM